MENEFVEVLKYNFLKYKKLRTHAFSRWFYSLYKKWLGYFFVNKVRTQLFLQFVEIVVWLWVGKKIIDYCKSDYLPLFSKLWEKLWENLCSYFIDLLWVRCKNTIWVSILWPLALELTSISSYEWKNYVITA